MNEYVILLRYIQSRVVVEKSSGNNLEANVGYRHNSPFFRARNVRHTKRVPNDHILIFDRLIIGDEFWQAIAAFALIRIDSSGINLLRIVARGPEMIIDELGTFSHQRFWRHIWQ